MVKIDKKLKKIKRIFFKKAWGGYNYENSINCF